MTPQKLRHPYATRVLEAGAELVDIETLLGHMDLSPPAHHGPSPAGPPRSATRRPLRVGAQILFRTDT
ncbi:MAG: hypothetical protein L0Z68_02195 [Gammaproteobacteria bacterium]|nr:hypothetical protein [Gammaproteobacteria bacterium]